MQLFRLLCSLMATLLGYYYGYKEEWAQGSFWLIAALTAWMQYAHRQRNEKEEERDAIV